MSNKAWAKNVVAYAQQYNKGTLLSQNFVRCGVCNACKRPAPSAHSRTGGVAHAIELNPANQDLIRNVSVLSGVENLVKVHTFAAYNETKEMAFMADKISTQAGRESLQLCHKCLRRRLPKKKVAMQAVTIDDFMQREGLNDVYFVSIDVEGFDPVVLEGMRKSIEARRVAVFEFETHTKAFWQHLTTPTEDIQPREQRHLHTLLAWISAAGYECFWQSFDGRLVPASGECWTPGMARVGWANMLCAHEPAVLTRLKAPDLSFQQSSQFMEAWRRNQAVTKI